MLEKKLREYLLNDDEELRDVVNELNSWNGCLDWLEFWENDEEFFNTFFHNNPAEAVRASFYGDYRYCDEYVRFNGYGNLESYAEYEVIEEIKDSIDEIVENLIEEHDNLYLSDDIEEIFEEAEEEEEEE